MLENWITRLHMRRFLPCFFENCEFGLLYIVSILYHMRWQGMYRSHLGMMIWSKNDPGIDLIENSFHTFNPDCIETYK